MNRAGFVSALGVSVALASRAARAQGPSRPNVMLGDEVFLNETWRELDGRCIGIVTNQTGVTSRLEHIVDAVRRNPQICVKALFAPEHGLRGDHSAGAYVPSYTDPRTNLPVYSLYGPTRHPTAAMLSGIDVLLFDIQDVGARDYTFVSTMAYVMQSAAKYGKEIWILDRPNPVGGAIVEGPVLEPRYRTFVGIYPIALRHGMTLGELAGMFNEAFGIHARLRVIPMRGWQRTMLWPDTGLSWIPTSPNIPTWMTALLYPCTGLAGTAGLNNGVGTHNPFGYAGHYEMDPRRYADALGELDLPGVRFRPVTWSPPTGFWANKTLGGVELLVFEPRVFLAVRTAVELLVTAREVMPSSISVGDQRGIDIIWGTDTIREGLLSGADADDIIAAWNPGVAAFKSFREKYLLY